MPLQIHAHGQDTCYTTLQWTSLLGYLDSRSILPITVTSAHPLFAVLERQAQGSQLGAPGVADDSTSLPLFADYSLP